MNILRKIFFVPRGNSQRGLTLVEMMVVIAIFAVFSTLVLVKYNQFNNTILLTNLAYEVALTVRQAQVYGVATRQTTPAGGSLSGYEVAYGARFESTKTNEFYFYVDAATKNNQCDGAACSSSNERIETLSLRNNYVISDFCAQLASNGQTECMNSGPAPSRITTLDITFIRPNPNAIIKTDHTGTSYRAASTTVSTADGLNRRIITIQQTGQITVQ